jgi:hypothetical protein
MVKGGWDQLRWLDLTAYKTRMKTKRFRDEQVREKAMILASRLSNILSPLFSKTASEDGQSFHTWDEDEETWKDRQYHYRALFEHALRMKCSSVLTDETYSFTFSLIPGRTIPNEATPPNAWLCISFQVYKSLPSEDDRISALVQTRNFLDLDPNNSPRLYGKVFYLTREESHFNSQRVRGSDKNHVSNDDGIVNNPPRQYNVSRGSISARELSGTTALREPGSIHRNHPKQPASERHGSDVAKATFQPTIAASSQSHGEQPPQMIMIVCNKCGKGYPSMSAMTPQGNGMVHKNYMMVFANVMQRDPSFMPKMYISSRPRYSQRVPTDRAAVSIRKTTKACSRNSQQTCSHTSNGPVANTRYSCRQKSNK